MGTEARTVGEAGASVRTTRPEEREPPRVVSFVAVLHVICGLFVLVVLPIYVVVWARQGEGAFGRALEARGVDAAWAQLFFFFWIAGGVSNLLAGVWLSRLRRRGMWLAAVCATLLLARGLADTAQGNVIFATVLLGYAFPLLSLYAVVRHRRRFVA